MQLEPQEVFTSTLKPTSKMVLLENIRYFKDGELVRDHCWVDYSRRINKLLAKKDYEMGKPIHVSFTAVIDCYFHKGKEKKKIRHIRNLSEV